MKHANIAFFVPHLGCPHRCSFCDQRRISGAEEPPDPRQVEQQCREALAGLQGREAEIAFFGGSFTAIPRGQMTALLAAAFPFVRDGLCLGIRLSTRPDALDEEICRILKAYGVTTVELGVQSMDDGILAQNGRGHDSASVRRGVALLRRYGFSVGLQIMPGLYGDTRETIWSTARQTAQLTPDFVRIYPTVVIEGTKLAELYRRGLYRPLGLEEAVALCAELLCFFEEERQIPVIRLGLHPSETLEKDLVAGPYHPAFRELAEGRIFFQGMQRQLQKAGVPPGRVEFAVNPREISKAAGQRRSNLQKLEKQGWQVRLTPKEGLPPRTVRLIDRQSNRQHGEEETGPCI
ncbi:MAG: radical SAM protein [Oscillospiraceae bacterium]|nr:radical SAM protein [Oscillospiraceae bacterium]